MPPARTSEDHRSGRAAILMARVSQKPTPVSTNLGAADSCCALQETRSRLVQVEESTWRGAAVRAGLVAETRRLRYRTLAQFSTRRPGTRLNSRSLLVTSETSALSA